MLLLAAAPSVGSGLAPGAVSGAGTGLAPGAGGLAPPPPVVTPVLPPITLPEPLALTPGLAPIGGGPPLVPYVARRPTATRPR